MSLLSCRKRLTPLQRRTTQLMGIAALLAVLTNFSDRHLVNPLTDVFPWLARIYGHSGPQSVSLVAFLAALSTLPVLLAVWAAARYLKGEPDEFIRAIAIRALLWGFAITMLGDAIISALMASYTQPFPVGLLNADLFLATTGIAFRLALRSYQ